MTTKSKQANPTQDSDEQLRQILTDLYYAQSRLTGTSTDPGTSRGAQLRKAKAALLAWRDQEVMKAKEQWHKDQRLAQWERNALAGNGDDAKRLEDL